VQEGAAGGTITAGGVYTAPSAAGTYHVIGTSAADPSKSATATVVVYVPVAVDASIIPADRRTVWNPGIPGGIPNVTTVHTTISAATYGNGTTDATSAINSAIQAAGATAASTKQPQVVFLPAGTYRTSGAISIDRSNVVLRGAGKGKTIINNQSVTAAAVEISGGQGYFKTTPVVNVVGSIAKGAATIEVANAAGFAVGDILQLDQLADGVPDGPANGVALYPGNWVWILDSWWSLRSPYANYGGDGGLSGKFPDSANGYRPIAQQVEVLAKNGNVLTIYDPATGRGSPAHLNYPASQNPQVWRSAGQAGYDFVRYAGLEDMTVWSSANAGDAKDMIIMGAAAYCWIKGVETDGSKNSWAGRHIHLFNGTYRCEVRQCYAHNSSNYNQGSNAYGIIYSGSECLIEDNVVRELNKPMVGETTGGGNVIAYNYVDEAIIGSLSNSWQETGINMSHGSFSHSDLFEGNHTPNVGVDSTHGNNGWGVMFRNWATGRNGSGGTNTYLRAIYVDGWSREMTSVGNVLWQPGLSCDYLGIPTPAVNVVYNGPKFIYLLGSNAWTPGSGNKPGADNMDNGQAASLFHRHMDFDYKSNSVYDNPANPVKTLPASLYLRGKPAFFGSSTWPWVDPGGATKVYTLPAKARFDAGTP
jgi:hypothetical protein